RQPRVLSSSARPRLMSSTPSLLAIMGSGETSPTMVSVHRRLFEQLGPDAAAVLLDTPVGFQMNADEIASKAVDYFRTSLSKAVSIATYRRADASSAVEYETAMKQLREAD